jgi:hypothetical protein
MHNNAEEFVEGILNTLKAQFGHTAKAFWVYDGDLCPCCMTRPIDVMIHNGKESLSVNVYMYREKGVLIAYLLCGECAHSVLEQTNDQTEFHASIEKTLKSAYLKHMYSMDA